MKPSSGESAPDAIMSRSESSREVSTTTLERVEVGGIVARSVDERAAVRGDQAIGRRGAGHAATSAAIRPSSSRLRDDLGGRLLGLGRLGVDDDLGTHGLLVRVVDAGEALDLAGEGLRVEPVHVAACALLDRGLDVDLDERAELLDHRARLVAGLDVRARSRPR